MAEQEEIGWIEGLPSGRLMVGPMPRGGRDIEFDVANWKSRGVEAVVSFLMLDEVRICGLQMEPQYCALAGMQFLYYPIEDHSVPKSKRATLAFLMQVKYLLDNGKSILFHCRAGIGRSALMAACANSFYGIDPETAFARISVARGYEVPELDEQRDWADDFHEFLTRQMNQKEPR